MSEARSSKKTQRRRERRSVARRRAYAGIPQPGGTRTGDPVPRKRKRWAPPTHGDLAFIKKRREEGASYATIEKERWPGSDTHGGKPWYLERMWRGRTPATGKK